MSDFAKYFTGHQCWEITKGLSTERFGRIKALTNSLPATMTVEMGKKNPQTIAVGNIVGKINSVLDLNHVWHCSSDKYVSLSLPRDPRW